MDKKYSFQQVLVLIGGIGGLAAGLYIGLRRFGLFQPAPESGSSPPSGDSSVGLFAFLLVFVLPFVIGLLALRSKRIPLQAAAWLGSGLLALVMSIFSFSAVTRIMFPVPGVLLLVAGAIAFLQPEVKKSVAVLSLVVGMVLIGAGSFYVLFLQEDPICWAQIRTQSGSDVWEERPAGNSEPIVLNDPDVGDVVGWTCSSDVFSSREGWYSVGIWVIGLLAGSILVTRRGFIE